MAEILSFIDTYLLIFNLAFTFIIASATLVYAYYARKAYQENKRLSKIQIISNLQIFIDEYLNSRKTQITQGEKDIVIKTIKRKLIKKWFPREFSEMENIFKEYK